MSLFKSGVLVSVNTLLCRIFGYIRDIFIASYLGTSYLGDVFAVAYRLPNFFRALFAEGAFSSAFVPVISAKLVSDGKEASYKFASNVMSILLIALMVVTIAIYIYLPEVMMLFAPGYAKDPVKFTQLVEASAITLPYMLLICLCSFISGLLNSHDRFFLGSFLPVIANIIMIFFIVFLSSFFANPMIALCYGVLVSGIVQLIIMIISIKISYRNFGLCKPYFDDEVKTMFKNMLPAILSSGIVQINLLINTIIASTIDGAVSKLYYAERLNQFPLAIIGTALGVVLLPKLSRLIKVRDFTGVNNIFSKSLQLALSLSLPACAAFLMLSDFIIAILFQRNAFSSTDTIDVANALDCLALGLPAFVLQKVLAPRFLAKLDTKTPMRISIANLCMNLLISALLVHSWGHVGIAFATAMSSWVSVVAYFYFLHKDADFSMDARMLIIMLGKTIAACLVMVVVIYGIKTLLPAMELSRFGNIIALCIIVTAGGASYFASILLFGVFKISSIKNIAGL